MLLIYVFAGQDKDRRESGAADNDGKKTTVPKSTESPQHPAEGVESSISEIELEAEDEEASGESGDEEEESLEPTESSNSFEDEEEEEDEEDLELGAMISTVSEIEAESPVASTENVKTVLVLDDEEKLALMYRRDSELTRPQMIEKVSLPLCMLCFLYFHFPIRWNN